MKHSYSYQLTQQPNGVREQVSMSNYSQRISRKNYNYRNVSFFECISLAIVAKYPIPPENGLTAEKMCTLIYFSGFFLRRFLMGGGLFWLLWLIGASTPIHRLKMFLLMTILSYYSPHFHY